MAGTLSVCLIGASPPDVCWFDEDEETWPDELGASGVQNADQPSTSADEGLLRDHNNVNPRFSHGRRPSFQERVRRSLDSMWDVMCNHAKLTWFHVKLVALSEESLGVVEAMNFAESCMSPDEKHSHRRSYKTKSLLAKQLHKTLKDDLSRREEALLRYTLERTCRAHTWENDVDKVFDNLGVSETTKSQRDPTLKPTQRASRSIKSPFQAVQERVCELHPDLALHSPRPSDLRTWAASRSGSSEPPSSPDAVVVVNDLEPSLSGSPMNKTRGLVRTETPGRHWQQDALQRGASDLWSLTSDHLLPSTPPPLGEVGSPTPFNLRKRPSIKLPVSDLGEDMLVPADACARTTSISDFLIRTASSPLAKARNQDGPYLGPPTTPMKGSPIRSRALPPCTSPLGKSPVGALFRNRSLNQRFREDSPIEISSQESLVPPTTPGRYKDFASQKSEELQIECAAAPVLVISGSPLPLNDSRKASYKPLGRHSISGTAARRSVDSPMACSLRSASSIQSPAFLPHGAVLAQEHAAPAMEGLTNIVRSGSLDLPGCGKKLRELGGNHQLQEWIEPHWMVPATIL